MATGNDKQIILNAKCLCGTHVFTTITPAASLPLVGGCCHCDSCRRLTGSMYSICALWPGAMPNLAGLRQYSVSPRISTFSCDKCGSSLFCSVVDLDGIYVILGTLDADDDNDDAVSVVAKYGSHMWVGDTLDGGASGWLARNSVDGEEIKRWMKHRGEELGRGEWGSQGGGTLLAASEKTLIGCHCGGIGFVLKSASGFGDGEHGQVPDYVEPGTFRYRTFLCACNSCRHASGTEVTPWATVPLANIETRDGKALPTTVEELKDAVEKGQSGFGTLVCYQASDNNVGRYRCSFCSANVFWAARDEPGTIGVAVGVLQKSGGGARREGLLAWQCKGGVLFKDNVAGTWREALVEALEKSEEWERRAAEESEGNTD